MALAQDLLPTLYQGRALLGTFGLCPYTVERVVRAWSGSTPGDGTRTETVVAIVEDGNQPPEVRALTDEELAIGNCPSGTMRVGPITPSFSGGGTAATFLAGSDLAAGEEMLYRLTGPEAPSGRLYTLHALHADDPFGYVIDLKPLAES